MKAGFFALLLVAAGLAGGCGGPPSPEASAPARTTNTASSNPGPVEPKAALGQNVDPYASQAVATEPRNRFVDDLHRKLDLCDQKISELGRKLESLNEQAKTEASKEMENWRVQRVQLGQKLDEIKQSTQEAGQDIKAGCESAVAELEKAFEKLKSRFKD